MDVAILKPEDVADQMKGANLAATVRKKLVGTDGARSHLVDVIRRFLLTVNLHAFFVFEFARRNLCLRMFQPG